MNEFVTQCGRDRVPIIWFQDTSGIDVGDIAEKAELLGLGQSLIYSIEQTDVPMMLVVLRKGYGCGPLRHGRARRPTTTMPSPWARRRRRSTSCTGRPPAAASFSRRLVKEKDAGKPLAADHRQDERAGPAVLRQIPAGLLRQTGFRGRGGPLRRTCDSYLVAFTNCVYQNPKSICPQHHLMLPRLIRSQIVKGLERPKKEG